MIDQLRPFDWSSEESVAFEAAVEAANGAVAAYTAVIAAEEAKAAPDARVIAEAREARARLAQERDQLDPADHQQIAAARARYTALAVEVRESRR